MQQFQASVNLYCELYELPVIVSLVTLDIVHCQSRDKRGETPAHTLNEGIHSLPITFFDWRKDTLQSRLSILIDTLKAYLRLEISKCCGFSFNKQAFVIFILCTLRGARVLLQLVATPAFYEVVLVGLRFQKGNILWVRMRSWFWYSGHIDSMPPICISLGPMRQNFCLVHWCVNNCCFSPIKMSFKYVFA